jgi:hypothetical protein
MLPPAPSDIVPYITAWSEEQLLPPRIIRRAPVPGIGYADETPHDRDSFGVLWVRLRLLPRRRRGVPRLADAHAYRQRRAMDDMLCQVCGRSPADPGGPHLFLMRSTGGPIREGELTASPPVCVPCTAIAVRQCKALAPDRWTAAWARHAPAWGVYGLVHDPRTLQVIPGRALERVEYDSAWAPWTRAARTVVQLQGVTPADLQREWAALGRDRLEEEFARVAALRAVA